MPKLKVKPKAKVAPELRTEKLIPKSNGVELLYRITEVEKGTIHLVFFDRFGTYCESHGVDCFTVAVAKRARK